MLRKALFSVLVLGQSLTVSAFDGNHGHESFDVNDLRSTHVEIENNTKKKEGSYRRGVVVGKLQDFKTVGIIFHSWEAMIEVGNLNQAKYTGKVFHFSTLDEKVKEKLIHLDRTRPHVFHYYKSFIRNPFTRMTRYDIVDVYPLKSGEPHHEGLDDSFTEPNLGTGLKDNGSVVGIIASVKRNIIRDFGILKPCTILLNYGGNVMLEQSSFYKHRNQYQAEQATGVALQKTGLNEVYFDMNSEAGCDYAEKIAEYGHEVTIQYSKHLFPIINNRAKVHKISLVH